MDRGLSGNRQPAVLPEESRGRNLFIGQRNQARCHSDWRRGRIHIHRHLQERDELLMSWLQRLVLAGIGFLAIALPLGGCGSGGGGSLGTGSTQSSSLNVYVTDGFSDQYSQVIVTLYKIEATSDGQNYQTLYSDDSGQTLDLTSLANAA